MLLNLPAKGQLMTNNTHFKIINPYTLASLGEIPFDQAAQIDDKLRLAVAGKTIMQALTPFERSQMLAQYANLILQSKEVLAKMITQEMGKTITDARIEIDRAVQTIKISGLEASHLHGEVLNTNNYSKTTKKNCIVQYFPIGIVFGIVPFNFPINLACHKIGPALAAGNPIMIKPNPQTYLSTKKLIELGWEAGIPKSCLQLIFPDIALTEQLIASEEIACISFTGSYAVAKKITKQAGIKKLLLELGGNDPLVIMQDGDIDQAVKICINQRFGCSGQRCTASKKVYVHEIIYESFKQKLVHATNALKFGNPELEDTFVGPVVHAQAADLVMKRIAGSMQAGAKVIVGNRQEQNIILPTILEDVPLTAELVADETFGPVIPLFKFKDYRDVIKELNATPFGLQAGLMTNQFNVIQEFYQSLEVGALIVNDGPGFRSEDLPFGGQKHSGLGREGIKYAMQEMSYHKALIY
jgi:acyl-CoA reductase-like NAD-dependent aldehyde dehydrogenase